MTIKYSDPQPFATPTIWNKPVFGDLIFDSYPRETLHYSAEVLEEIMFEINVEYNFHKKSKPTWKRYKSSVSDYEAFSPHRDGRNLQKMSTEYFPQIVSDIQSAIETLVADTRIPDDLGSLFARIFTNKTTAALNHWRSYNKLRDGLVVPNGIGTDIVTLNPLLNASNSTWPFPANSDHVQQPPGVLGIDLKGNPQIENEPGSIESSASDWPSSVIGKQRTESNYPLPGKDTTGIDGIDIPMRAAGRPGPFARKNLENTSLGVGENKVDLDGGYTFLSHQPAVVQQLRYQPPLVEHFNGDTFSEKWYTSNVYSQFTRNLPWHLSQPVEKQWLQDWGWWLIKGKCGVSNSTLILGVDAARGGIITNCPQTVFYWAGSTACTCGAGEVAYAVWNSNYRLFSFNEIPLFQLPLPNGNPKPIGPKTRLRIKHSFTGSPGAPTLTFFMEIRLMLSSFGDPPQTGFTPIYVEGSHYPDVKLESTGRNLYTEVESVSKQTHPDGSISVNIFEAVDKISPGHSSKIKSDNILALSIRVVHQVFASSDVATGTDLTIIGSKPSCSMGSARLTMDYLMLYEPPIEGEDDPRFAI
jgi:hypothetical protein